MDTGWGLWSCTRRMEDGRKKLAVDDAIPETGETELVSVDERVIEDETAAWSGVRGTNAPFN